DWSADYTVNGSVAGDAFGSAIVSVGDLDGDGTADFVTGSPSYGASVFRSGSISFFSGADGSLLATRDGEEYGEGTGGTLAYLGTYENDNLALIASSSPFFPSSNGNFSGIIRIYSYDINAGILDLFMTIEGVAPGEMLGMSMVGFQHDLVTDNSLELAASAIGHNGLDGAVYIYKIDSATAEASIVSTIEGVAGQQELLGFSLSKAALNNQATLLIGSPFAYDSANRAGAVSVLSNTSQGIISLTNPFSGTENAYLGFAVAAGEDVTGDGVADFISSAPYLGNGHIVTWKSVNSLRTLEGSYAGEAFGSSIALIQDLDFDGISDIIVGAPQAANDKGRVALHNLASASQDEIHSFVGSDVGQMLGSAVTTITNSDISPILMGSNESISRHSLEIDDVTISASGTYEVLTDITVGAEDLFIGSNVYFYVGESNTPSTFGNHDLDISGNVQLFASYTTSGHTEYQDFAISELYPDGTNLIFQVVEEYGFLTRYSDLSGGSVIAPDISTTVTGNFEWDTDVTVRANNLYDGGTVYFYVGQSNVPSTVGNHDLNISGNVMLIESFANSNSTVDQLFTIPNSLPDGTNLYFQVVEEYNSLTRYSNLSGGMVVEPTPFVLFNQGNTAGQQMGLRVTGADPWSVVEFYGTLNGSIDPLLGTLINAGNTGGDGSTTIYVNVPASMSGATAYLRAQNTLNGKKTQVLTVDFL
ncbi:integrin alpha, partial [Planctomycetota bacterium]|nr:integrin alpha [Planctomycetota bacterium]